jgi:hypothetical protein
MGTDRKSDHRVIIYVEQDVLDWLRSEHARLNVSVSEVVRRALRDALNVSGVDEMVKCLRESGEIHRDGEPQ